MRNLESEEDVSLMGFYGTLRKDYGVFSMLGLGDKLRYAYTCRVPGTLYSLERYPGLILEGDSTVICDVFEILDPICLPLLDEYEDFFPNDPEHSRYLRKKVMPFEGKEGFWVYVYNKDVSDLEVVESGDWLEYKK
ncbi:MAG: hypothetical protein GYB31_06495 [Bacteroidetes bacterium]|nr:hypothetical protein [Bacteroidota bacterium]